MSEVYHLSPSDVQCLTDEEFETYLKSYQEKVKESKQGQRRR